MKKIKEYSRDILVGLKNILIFVFFKSTISHKDKKQTTVRIHTISYREFSPYGGKGGGSAVQSCQHILLGETYNRLDLKYTYLKTNKFSNSGSLSDLWGGAYFAILNTQKERNTAYITHDYGTAFGLALLGKKFVYISHLQGPRVEEKLNFGEYLPFINKNIITLCERFVFKKAFYVCFPSAGAKKYYFESSYKSIDESCVNIGPILHNTLYTNPQAKSIDNLENNKNILTFYSVASLTYAKGVDQIITFFEEFLKKYNKNVRWILVGDGVLKNKILASAESLKLKYENFNFFYIDKCSYEEITYISQISDIYIMLQRISIFDLSTLEAMRNNNLLILSGVGGNIEFNKEDNILYYRSEKCFLYFHDLIYRLNYYKMKNKKVYEKYFNNSVFIDGYRKLIEELL